MNGLVYSVDDDADSTPVYWMGVAVAALILHAIPFFFLNFSSKPMPVETDETVMVSLDDSFLNMLPDPDAPPAAKTARPAPELPPVAPSKLMPPPEPDAPAAVVEPPPVSPAPPKGAQQPPPPAAPKPAAPPAVAEKRPLNEKDLPALKQNPDTAFDEDKHVTKKAPSNAYFSDRNSTAADRGPKNLPQGDPYLDKGDTNLIKYLGKRGEGNKPAMASDANSGSVKKEGAEESGDGRGKQAADFSKNVRTAEITTPNPKESALKREPGPEKPAPVAKTLPIVKQPEEAAVSAPPPSVVAKVDVRAPLKSKPFQPEPVVSETGTVPPPKRVKEVAVADTVPLPSTFELDTPKRPRPSPANMRNESVAAQQTQAEPSLLQPTSIDKAIDEQAELDRFEAQLNGTNVSGGADGGAGTGARMRKGKKGHEGNGTARPGDDNAVSDVTSINLESSAAEFGDPRFAKRFDPKTAYIKALARRIDGKWKADIQAHLRVHPVPGTVSIRIIIRKDGMLMDASEAYRDRGVPDDNVATARRAVREAASPMADPFPPALEDRDTIEYTFNFLYQ